MREIKFRAWNKKTNEYNYFVELTSFIDGSLSVSAGKNNNNPVGNSEDFILEQYTGLKDREGVEIFEGDIVTYFNTYSKKHYKQIVKWCEMQSCFALFEEQKDVWQKESDWLKIIETVEVIGNIHENN